MRNPAFHKLLDEIRTTHDAKSNDYAADDDPLSNLRRADRFGVPPHIGVMVRMSDKWGRLEQLASGKKAPKYESVRDTLVDLANYALLAVLLLDERESS
jgi:hypothetical protein